ncbi:GNAT family N-acetyltransferase [Stenotrophomonas sp.]|uniref:GNAT family N-acetyltransferase n=1 Tax=Stenotrophomonas sp. TaxID=69392 RepID=UPI00289BE60D|nr:GNAT family N-acetyltransferase [Stenotrophomonas sp.]
MGNTVHFRLARADDLPSLIGIDSVAADDPRRAGLLQQWVAARHCHLLLLDARVAAYGVLHHHFFDSGFIEMLMVGKEFRRRGLGKALLQHLVSRCERPRLFTSTNASNAPMHALLARNGFIASGQIDNLDPGDPEKVLFRDLAGAAQPAV